MTTTTTTATSERFQALAHNMEEKATRFAAWTVNHSGVTRIVSREKLIDSKEATTTANHIKKIALAFFTGLTLLVPAAIGFTAQRITAALSKVWTSVVGKAVEPDKKLKTLSSRVTEAAEEPVELENDSQIIALTPVTPDQSAQDTAETAAALALVTIQEEEEEVVDNQQQNLNPSAPVENNNVNTPTVAQ